MDYELTWEDLDEDRGLLALFERGPAPEGDESRYAPISHLRIVVEGETFIAILDPQPSDEAPPSFYAMDGDECRVAFFATDAYDAIEKAQKVVAERNGKAVTDRQASSGSAASRHAEREAAKKRQRKTKKRA